MHWRESKEAQVEARLLEASEHYLCRPSAAKVSLLNVDNDKVLNRTRERNPNDMKGGF